MNKVNEGSSEFHGVSQYWLCIPACLFTERDLAIIVKDPFWIPAAPIPAIARAIINIFDVDAIAQIKEPSSKITKNTI